MSDELDYLREIAPEQRMMFSQLSAATVGLVVHDPAVRLWMITRLMTCEAHKGVHHFAVSGEGTTLWMSQNAIDCLGIDEVEEARVKRLTERDA